MKGTLTEPLISPAGLTDEAALSKDDGSTHASIQNGHGGGHHSNLPSKDYGVSVLT